MLKARLARLLAEVRSDRQAFAAQLDTLATLDVASGGSAVLALTAWCLHHAYTSVESLLVRITRELGEESDTGADWHQRLLDSAALEVPGVRPALLRPSTVLALHELRAFRHFVRHGYATPLDALRLTSLREHAIQLRPQLETDLGDLEAWLSALADSEG